MLCGIGKGDAPPPEQGPPRVEMEDVELTLGLSLGGRFGLDRTGEKLARSSFVATAFTTPVVPAAPPTLPRTSSLPVDAEASEALSESGGLSVEHAARLPASGSPSSGSSDAEEQKLQGALVKTTSLPAGIEATGTEEWRKRKVAQSLKRLEVKRKRIERRNSHTCNISKEAVGQILGEMHAKAEKLESIDEAVPRNNGNHRDSKHPKHQATIISHDSFSAVQKKPDSAFKGTAMAMEHSPSSAVQPLGEAARGAMEVSPPMAARAAALASRGDQQNVSGGAAARAGSMRDVERKMMQEMPGVFTKDLPNGNRVEGFLYKYRKGEEVRIVCICHGSFLTPAEFVEHGGGGKVAYPLRHIVVSPLQNL